MAVSVPGSSPLVENGFHRQSPEIENFRHIISESFVFTGGSDEKVPLKILCDTAAYDTFIEASVLPFTDKNDSGSCFPVLGMGLNVIEVPMHSIMLYSDLFQGQAAVGVRPALPMESVNVLLGNGLVGDCVWAEVPIQLEVDVVSVVRRQPDDTQTAFPEVFTSSAVTHAMTRDTFNSSLSDSEKIKLQQ